MAELEVDGSKKDADKEHLIVYLKLFNEKAEKLRTLPFTSDLHGSGVTIKWSKETKRIEAFRRGPHGQSIDAFILTLRLFIQDNSKISIRKLAEYYRMLDVPEDLKQQFAQSRVNLNKFLEQDAGINHNNNKFSNRDILELVIYGGYAHANLEKKRLYDGIMNFGFMGDLITNEFVHITGNILNFILCIRELNLILLNSIETVSN